MAYSAEPANGVTLLTVYAAHAMAALSRCVGDLVEVSAATTVRYDKVGISGTSEQVRNGSPNEVALMGRLSNGALATITVHGGSPPGMSRLSFRIVGSHGALLIETRDPTAAINVGDWVITLMQPDGRCTLIDVPPSPAVPDGLTGPAKNVAAMYHEFARAIAGESPVQPDFAMAARFQRAVETIDLAARTGRRQAVAPYSEI
jgi:predicted dehydrogenase